MKYQLILQWPKSSLAEYDSLIEIENLLIEQLTDRSQVDGHDIGAGQANIFILTDDPQAAFGEVRAILSKTPSWSDARAAYRQNESDEYKILWAENLTEFTVT